ncbi:hypothetical protein [Silvanigrella aquatica]|uniref:Uncharacterized protein n=1 Tax=Silvanigrella aquatica TaxID=1915309 RepID=A0A1L4CXJ7_9BACT|nr:hypothetical protein [Silvanigrella aquatica]APJ02669.1 hypothetical protein AXG55_01470 [Silvanigrella aquatica]
MTKVNAIKFYTITILAFVTLLAPLLPWMSYGVGSKTGIDIGGKPTYIIFISALCLIIFNFIIFKTDKIRKVFLFLAFLASITLFTFYCYEIIRIAYQTVIAQSLPVEMFGVVSLSAKEIRVGYGLWVGGSASLLSMIIHFVTMRLQK